MRLSAWRLAGVGFVTLSATGVIASAVCGIAYGLLWGAGAYASTFLVLLGVISAAARIAPPVETEVEDWQLAPPPPVAAASEIDGVAAASSASAIQAASLSGRPVRRLSDKITMAFEHACEIGDVRLAEKLLESLELVLLRGPSAVEERALHLEIIIAGRNRLATLRGPAETGATTDATTDTRADA